MKSSSPTTRTVIVPGPQGWPGAPPLSMNRHLNHFAKARMVRRLREETVGSLRAEAVVVGAEFVTATLHYRPAQRRTFDPNNLLPSLKPVVDALQPYSRSVGSNGRVRENIGYGVIPDDDAEHCRQTDVVIEPPQRGAAAWWVVFEIRYPADMASISGADAVADAWLVQRWVDMLAADQ